MKTFDTNMYATMIQPSLPDGQQQARSRWGTHASGAAFDRKKSTYLTEQARTFIAQQSQCVIAGLDDQNEPGELLVLDMPGFVQTPDEYTCLLRVDSQVKNSRILQRLLRIARNEHNEQTRLGLFFISHPTRERLCVQGVAELVPGNSFDLDYPSHTHDHMLIRLYVQRSFFHCAKYIKTRIPGLTNAVDISSEEIEQLQRQLDISQHSRAYLSGAMQTFIAQQTLSFLCTVDHEGQCAVNHRGGAAGFLVTLPPDASSPAGTILLPDYAGNGAFEANGNILETGRAALLIPHYAAQLALCVSGSARILEMSDLTRELAQRCPGAERVIALSVQRVEVQRDGWSTPPASAYAQTESMQDGAFDPACIV